MSYGATETGFLKKSYDEILDSLRSRARTADYFGPEADLSPYGPLGILIELMANELSTAWEGLEENYNDAYVETAVGVALERVAKIVGVTRQGKVRYTTTLQIKGEKNVIVAEGFTVKTNAGIEYTTVEDVTIQNDDPDYPAPSTRGLATVTARAKEYGYSSAVLAGQLTQIVSPQVGVYAVINTDDATGGNPTEPDRQLRERTIEKASLNTQNVGSVSSIRIMIESDDQVRSCLIEENTLHKANDAGMPAHSLRFVVDGGSDDHVARLIYQYKTAGVALYANLPPDPLPDPAPDPMPNGVSVPVFDDYGEPQTIVFDRPRIVELFVYYDIPKGSGWTDDNIREIKRGTVEVIGGTDTYELGGQIETKDYWGLKSGDDVYPLQLYGIILPLPGTAKASVKVKRLTDDEFPIDEVIEIAPDEIARVRTENIEVYAHDAT